VKHLTQAEPSADLREALLNTDYITSLIKLEKTQLEKTPLSADICDSLLEFLSFLKGSVSYLLTYSRLLQHSYLFLYLQKFTDTEELYLHHRNIYDGVIHNRIADFPYAEFVFFLVLIEMLPHLTARELYLKSVNPLEEVNDGIRHIHSTLRFNSPQYFAMTLDYRLLLGESLSHPVHAGKYVLDGQKYAFVARFLLDNFIEPSSEENFLRQVVFFPAINGILT
jgi:hypothetical protein